MGACGVKALVVRNKAGGKLRQVGRVLRLPISQKRAVLGKVVNVVHGINPHHIPLGIALLRLDSGHGLRTVSDYHFHIISRCFLKHIADYSVEIVQVNQKGLRLLWLSLSRLASLLCLGFFLAALRLTAALLALCSRSLL